MAISDFEILKLVGEGAYARVYKVRHKLTNSVYAMKAIDQMFMEKVLLSLNSFRKAKNMRSKWSVRCC